MKDNYNEAEKSEHPTNTNKSATNTDNDSVNRESVDPKHSPNPYEIGHIPYSYLRENLIGRASEISKALPTHEISSNGNPSIDSQHSPNPYEIGHIPYSYIKKNLIGRASEIDNMPYSSSENLDDNFSSSKASDQKLKAQSIKLKNKQMLRGKILDNNKRNLAYQITSPTLPTIEEYEYEGAPPLYNEVHEGSLFSYQETRPPSYKQAISNLPPYEAFHNNSSIELKNELVSRSRSYTTGDMPNKTKGISGGYNGLNN